MDSGPPRLSVKFHDSTTEAKLKLLHGCAIAILLVGCEPKHRDAEHDASAPEVLSKQLGAAKSMARADLERLKKKIAIDMNDGGEPIFGVVVEMAPGTKPPTIDGATFLPEHIGPIYTGRVEESALDTLAAAGGVKHVDPSTRFQVGPDLAPTLATPLKTPPRSNVPSPAASPLPISPRTPPRHNAGPLAPPPSISLGHDAGVYTHVLSPEVVDFPYDISTGIATGYRITFESSTRVHSRRVSVVPGRTYEAQLFGRMPLPPLVRICKTPECDREPPLAEGSNFTRVGFISLKFSLPKGDTTRAVYLVVSNPEYGGLGLHRQLDVVVMNSEEFETQFGVGSVGMPFEGASGAGALVVVIEAAPGLVDPCHPAFASKNDPGQSRVEAMEIVAFAGDESVNANSYVRRHCNDSRYWDTTGHPTATVGIAAGAPRTQEPHDFPAGPFAGAATQAQIASISWGHDSGAEIRAIARAKTLAKGRPVAIGLSWNRYDTYPSGRAGDAEHERVAKAIQMIVGPGVTIVAAAGNAGDNKAHAHGSGAHPEQVSLRVNEEIDVVMPVHKGRDPAQLRLVAPPTGYTILPPPSATNELTSSFELIPNTDPPADSTMTLEVSNAQADGWDLYISSVNPRGVPAAMFLDHVSPYGTIAPPAIGPGIVVVTGYSTFDTWHAPSQPSDVVAADFSPIGTIASISSRGTAGGGAVPTVSAPFTTIGPLSPHSNDTPAWIVGKNELVFYGTSAALPIVLGIAAALYEIDPTNFPLPLLQKTAHALERESSGMTRAEWHASYGAGKVNGLAAVRALKENIAHFPQGPTVSLSAEFHGKTANFVANVTNTGQAPSDGPISLYLWRLTGDGTNTSIAPTNTATNDYSSWPSGQMVNCEVVAVNAYGRTTIGKTQIRIP